MDYQEEHTRRRVRALDGTFLRVARKGAELIVNGRPTRISARTSGIVALVTTDKTVQVSSADD